MILNHLTIALRIVRRHRIHAAINILGLAVAMAASIIILLYVWDDLGFERLHANADRIYRVFREYTDKEKALRVALTPQPLAAALKHDLVEVEEAASVSNPQSAWVRRDGEWLKVEPVHFAEPAFFRIFSFDLCWGTLEKALQERRSAVLTIEQAEKMFGNQNPVGKTITVRGIGDLRVTAVIEKPRQSHLLPGIILPMTLYVPRYDIDPKMINNFTTYILAAKHEDEDSLRRSVAAYAQIFWGPETKETFQLQALRRIWLHSDYAYDFIKAPYKADLDYLMLTVAFSILAMACFNYINIETARAGRRAAEVSLRKALGAGRRQLIVQFLGEAWVLSTIAFCLSLVLVEIALPAFNRFTIIKDLRLFDSGNMMILLMLLGVAAATGLAAGGYPALLLAAVPPARVLKKRGLEITGAMLRKALVVIQFSVSILLIVGTLVMSAQLNYMRSKDPGYEPKHLVCVKLTEAVVRHFGAFKADLLRHPRIVAVTAARDLPTWRGPSITIKDWEGRTDAPGFLINYGAVDRDFIETMQIELAAGTSFSRDHTGKGLIVNQAAVDRMGMSDPIGKSISGWRHEGRIIGVVKDYFYNSMRERIEPLVLKVSTDDINFMLARISPEKTTATLAAIEQAWAGYEPELPAHPVFLDEQLNRIYLTESKVTQLLSYASMIAVWISCLGLYGLTTFIAAQRSKEIAIRKAYGASTGAILGMLTVEYVKILSAAILISWPAAYVALNRWLETFAQHIRLDWRLLVPAALIAVAVVFVTVFYQALKTASANPAEALRYE